ncbi:MAG: DNA-processing protein DprA [Candidatus Nomurabacteria bacterium]|jgi:DNA processing protein|nr:DNA-processing protein DprA [Candidatus Nomurabacteria bacterium]
MDKITEINPRNHIWLKRLTKIPQPVSKLYYMGRLPDKQAPTVAIIGSRKPTAYGREITLRLAEKLARRGVVIVSGLALGHDALAHRGALNGGGVAVAVLGTPLPTITPRTNRALGEEILQSGGAIISEIDKIDQNSKVFYKTTFLQRNRIVAGLADVLIVTEASRRSGTMSTVRHALEQGKEVMAVPGNVTSPLSVGCNILIQQGATPILCVEDVLEKLGIFDEPKQLKLHFKDPREQKIYDLIAGGLRDGDELQRQSGLSASEYLTAITMLELSGSIRGLGANNWGLK